MQAWEKTALVLIYAALLNSRSLSEALSVPINTIAALILFGLATRRVARELGITGPSRWRALVRSGVAPTR